MGYCTQAELQSLFSADALAQFTAESGVVTDSDVLALVIADASDRIDGYLTKYLTPVTDSDSVRILRPHAVVWCRWILIQRRMLRSYPEAENDLKMTIKFLERIQDGKGSLPGASERTNEAPALADRAAAGSEEQVYGTEPLAI